MDSSALTIAEIRFVSKAVTGLLTNAGFSCCLVGSVAGYEHNITRIPNDVDVLVMTDKSPDAVKDYLVSNDSSFNWTEPPTNPNATYRVLCYNLSPENAKTPAKSCRVDVFTPGMIHLPRIPDDRIAHSESNLPIMPYFPVVLHKIQAWKAHLASTKPWATIKQKNDINDINDLLKGASATDQRLQNQTWLEQWFLDAAFEGVQEYVGEHPDTIPGWLELGFPIPKDSA